MLVLLESSDIGVRYSSEAARLLGLEPVFLCDLKDYHGDTLEQLKAYRHYDTPTHSVEAILRFLGDLVSKGELGRISGITSFADSRLAIAQQVAQRLGVHGLDPEVIRLKSKAEVARLASSYCPPSIAIDPEDLPLGPLQDLLATSGKIVLKPAQGAGARGVTFVESATELKAIRVKLRNRDIPREMELDGWIAQSFVEGELFSAEGYVLQGKPSILGYTGRKKIHSTETAADFPIDSRLSEPVRARASLAISELIASSGFRNGYFHVEFIYSSNDQCFLVDANIGRLGGGPVGEMLAFTFGIDPIEIYRHVLEVSLLGRESRNPYEGRGPKNESYAVLYGLREGGLLAGIDIPGSMNCRHTLIQGPGARVTPMGVDDWSWIGILTGRKTDVMDAIERIRIRTSEGVFPPCY